MARAKKTTAGAGTRAKRKPAATPEKPSDEIAPDATAPDAGKQPEPSDQRVADTPSDEKTDEIASSETDAPKADEGTEEAPVRGETTSDDKTRPDEKPADDHKAASQPQTAPAQKSSGGGFMGGFIGGAIAAAIIAGLIWATNPDILGGSNQGAESVDQIATGLAEQSGRNDAFEAELASLREEISTLRALAPEDAGDQTAQLTALEAGLTERIEATSAALEDISAALSVLEGRIAQVEARPPVVDGTSEAEATQIVTEMREALEAQRAELATLADDARNRITAAEEEAAALQTEAQETARAAVARSALSRLQASLDAGGPFAGALSDLTGTTSAEIAPILVNNADTGIPTLLDLQQSYSEAARAGLAASIRAGLAEDDSAMNRLGAFLRTQTGARSVTPRDGDDPDALLSRAEAALGEGRLADTMDLIAVLPEPGQEAMADWRSQAQTRLDATAALDALAASISQN